jgi:MFS family permease
MQPQDDGVFAPSRRALTAGILLSITAMACEGMAVATILPSVAVDLGGLGDYGWAFSAFMLASLVGAISAGRAADRNDILSPSRAGFAAFAVGLLIAGLAPNWPVFLVGRCVQGFGAGTFIAVAYVAIARAYPETLRPRLMALLSSAWVLPALIGPAAAGQVAEHASWRLVFLGILPPVALGAWMLLPRLRALSAPSNTAVPGGPDRVFASLRLTAGIALVLLAASMNLLPVAVALVAVGLVLALPALQTLLPAGTATARNGLAAAVGLRCLLAFGFFGAEALIPLGLATERGVPPSLVGLALTAGALAWVAGSWAQDRAEAAANGSLGQRAVRAAGGLLCVAIGIAGGAVVIINTGLPLVLVIAAWTLAGFGMGLAYPAATLTALGNAAAGEEGAAASSLQVAETIGTAVGTGAAGALFALAGQLQRAESDGLSWGFIVTVVVLFVGLMPAARLAPATPGGGAVPLRALSEQPAPAADSH